MIKLILGGRNNGKKDYLLGCGYTQDDFCTDFTGRILYKLNDVIKNNMDNENVTEYVLEQVRDKDIIIVCDEVGCGIVPIDKNENDYREKVGRCCCALAKTADSVERVYSGIAAVIK